MADLEIVLKAALYVAGGALFASIAAFLVAAFGDSRVDVARTFADAPAEPFPRPRLLRFTALGFRFTYFAMMVTVPLVLLLVAIGIRSGLVLAALTIATIGTIALVLGLSAIIRCPKCTKRAIMNAGLHVAFAEPLEGLSPWGSVVKRIARERRFRCMHCGQRFTVQEV